MGAVYERIRRIGWTVVEAATLLVILCVLLDIILGQSAGPFISDVAANATAFLQSVPPGALLGIVLIVLLYWFFRVRQLS